MGSPMDPGSSRQICRQWFAIEQAEADLLTRAMAGTPLPRLAPPPSDDTFQWELEPATDLGLGCSFFVDGSLLFAEHRFFGMCARRGWAFVVLDQARRLVAAAKGRPPSWADGIHGTELWGFLQAASCASPSDKFSVDCLAVQLGAQRGLAWATAPQRRLARAWAPLAHALGDEADRVRWMPAHCSSAAAGSHFCSDGSTLLGTDIIANDYADEMAKSVASADQPSWHDRQMVLTEAERVTQAAQWIGRATALANHFPQSSMDRWDGAPP